MTMITPTAPAYKLTDNDLFLDADETAYKLLRVKDLEDDDKPREKLLNGGPSNLSIAELTAVLWGVGTKKEDVLAMAQRTLHEYGEKTLSHEFSAQRLAEATDIPLVKACQIIAALELGRRFYASKSGRPVYVRTAKQAYEYLSDMGSSNKEQLRGLYLNSRYQVIHDEVISVGSLTSNIVHPREVFQPAIEHYAMAVIIAYNHPSGSLDPTNADLEVTTQLISAGQVLGIDLLDHLIVTSNNYASIINR